MQVYKRNGEVENFDKNRKILYHNSVIAFKIEQRINLTLFEMKQSLMEKIR